MHRTALYNRDFSAGLGAKYQCVYDLVPADARLLELGCSTGFFSTCLIQKAGTVIAVDHDPSAIAACRKRGIECYQIDLSSTEIDPVLAEHAPFDAVVAMDLLEHLPNPQHLLT